MDENGHLDKMLSGIGKEVAQQKANDVERFIKSTSVAKIENQTTFDFVNDAARRARELSKEIERVRRSITEPLNVALRAANGLFKPPVDRLDAYVVTLKGLMLAYQKEQDRIRIEAQRKAEEEARKERLRIEAEEREKREEQARAMREAQEAIKKAEQAKSDEEAAAATAQAEEAVARAEQASREADAKKAVAQTVVAPVVPVPGPAAKKGVYGVKTYNPVVIDKKAFLRWALASDMLTYVGVNESLLKKEATATKGERKWPGVRIDIDDSARMR